MGMFNTLSRNAEGGRSLRLRLTKEKLIPSPFCRLVSLRLSTKARKRRWDSWVYWSMGMLTMAVTTSRNPGTAAVLSILLLIWFWALTLMTTMCRRLRLRICCSNTLSGYISVMSKRLRMPRLSVKPPSIRWM